MMGIAHGPGLAAASLGSTPGLQVGREGGGGAGGEARGRGEREGGAGLSEASSIKFSFLFFVTIITINT